MRQHRFFFQGRISIILLRQCYIPKNTFIADGLMIQQCFCEYVTGPRGHLKGKLAENANLAPLSIQKQ